MSAARTGRQAGRAFTAAFALSALAFAAVTSTAPPGQAETLREALAAAYASNPTLEAERARLRASDEGVALAGSGWRPTITASADAGVAESDSSLTGSDSTTPTSYGLTLNQPLYRGGRTVADTSRARNQVFSDRARLVSVEQSVLLDAATAYINVLRDSAVLQLRISNEQVLRRELEATRDRAAVGDANRTDVSQAEARHAGAIAGRILAASELDTARAVYRRVIGHPPRDLVRPQPIAGLPGSLDQANALAEEQNPAILSAIYAERSAQDDVRLNFGELLPSLSLNGSVEHSEDTITSGASRDDASIIAQLTVPLYQAGAPSARVRRSKQVASQRRLEVEDARRQVREETTQAWEGLNAARASINQFEIQVRANQIALDGTREEARVGSRTVLDVLNAEQELLDAQVSLVDATAVAVVAELRLLAAVGRLTARDMGLQVEIHDDEAYFNKVKSKLWGTGINGDE